MKRLMRYKALQCFLAAPVMIALLAPSAYASGAPDTYEASANAVSEKYIGKTVPGACVVISEHDNRVTSMTFRLAHDYVPAGPLNGFAGSFLSLGSYILLTLLWLAILIVLSSKIVCKRTSFQWQRIILPICGLIPGAAGIAGMLHWFSLYTIISTELNIVAGIGIAAAICGIFTGFSYVVKRKNRASVLTIVLFALQIISAWMLGFLTVV